MLVELMCKMGQIQKAKRENLRKIIGYGIIPIDNRHKSVEAEKYIGHAQKMNKKQNKVVIKWN